MSPQTHTAIPTAPPPGARPATRSGVVPYRLTDQQFEKMIEKDILHDGDRVHLLDGILFKKIKKNPPHDFGVRKSVALLRGLLPAGWFVDEEKPIKIGRWSRQPDITVIRGQVEDYAKQDPTAAEVRLIAEVSDSSYAIDRGVNWRKYAAARIPVYWIIDLAQRQIEVYSAPSGKGKAAGYRDSKVYGQDDEVPVILEGRELGRIKVRDILPSIVKS
jgi:Uma2 family endonuclease